jgi:hypothetical protein
MSDKERTFKLASVDFIKVSNILDELMKMSDKEFDSIITKTRNLEQESAV